MARKPSPTLTDGEVRLMNILWKKGHATVSEVVAGLPRRPPVAYNTVQTCSASSKRRLRLPRAVGRRFVPPSVEHVAVAAPRPPREIDVRRLSQPPRLNVLGDEGLERSQLNG
jgi:hypothetical protein